MAKKYDDFDEPERDGLFGQVASMISSHKRGFSIAAAVAALFLLGVIVFGSNDETTDVASTSVPVVRADAENYKSAPDNPGGMEIPYRDSTVFASGEADSAAGKTENILADDTTEQPLPKEQLFAGLNTNGAQNAPNANPTAMPPQGQLSGGEIAATEAGNAGMNKVAPVAPPSGGTTTDPLVAQAIGTPPASQTTAQVPAPVAAVQPPAPDVKKESPIASIQPKVIEPAPAAKAEKKVQAKAETKAASVEPAAGVAAAKGVQPGGYYVQLASVKSTASAAAEYKKIQAKYSALSGVKYRTQEANLGAKGTFNRIQAGPMSKDDATRICGSIKSGGGACLVAAK